MLKIKEHFSSDKLNFMQQLSSINPFYVINHPNSTIVRFENLLLTLTTKRFFLPEKCDNVLILYKKLVKRLKLEFKDECLKFNSPTNCLRLDKFYLDIF